MLFYSVIYVTHFSFICFHISRIRNISKIFCMDIYEMTNQLSKTTLKSYNCYNQQVQNFKYTMNQYVWLQCNHYSILMILCSSHAVFRFLRLLLPTCYLVNLCTITLTAEILSLTWIYSLLHIEATTCISKKQKLIWSWSQY